MRAYGGREAQWPLVCSICRRQQARGEMLSKRPKAKERGAKRRAKNLQKVQILIGKNVSRTKSDQIVAQRPSEEPLMQIMDKGIIKSEEGPELGLQDKNIEQKDYSAMQRLVGHKVNHAQLSKMMSAIKMPVYNRQKAYEKIDELSMVVKWNEEELIKTKKRHQAEVLKLQTKVQDQKIEQDMLNAKIKEQAREMETLRQSSLSSMKRSLPDDEPLNQKYDAKVRHYVQEKKQRTIPEDKSPSLQERRAFDKKTITEHIKANEDILIDFDQIMKQLVKDKPQQQLRVSEILGDFTDGFRLNTLLFNGGNGLVPFLNVYGLSINPFIQSHRQFSHFLQLAEGPYDLELNLRQLRNAIEEMKLRMRGRGLGHANVCLQQLDVTRDVGGTLFIPVNFRRKYTEIDAGLREEFGTDFTNNGNSFDTCLQFVEAPRHERPYLRIKIYNKVNQHFQSETAAKSLGMNTNAIYHPSMRMQHVLQEFEHEGVTRIEISYYADSVEAEECILSDGFAEQASNDINRVLKVLGRSKDIVWRVSMLELFETFTEMAKKAQLFIQEPTVAALVFAKNSKKGSYTGFYKPIPQNYRFDEEEFLKPNMLEGPGSIVHVVQQKRGPGSGTIKKALYKSQSISHIPGLVYKVREVAYVAKPDTWSSTALPTEMVRSIQLHEMGEVELVHPLDSEPEAEDVADELSIWDFIQWCGVKKVTHWEELEVAPPHIQMLMKKPGYRKKIMDYLRKKRWLENPETKKRTRIWADQKEQKEMDLCHADCVKLIETFIEGLPGMKFRRALEAACGDARFGVDYLSKNYEVFDVFDQDERAIKKVNEVASALENVGNINCSSMQSYEFLATYDNITLRWCIGYLEMEALVLFLMRCKINLNNSRDLYTRNSPPEAYIIILDNVEDPGVPHKKKKGQWIRDQDSLKEIFTKAGLRIWMQSKKKMLHKDYYPVMLWALY